VKTSQEIRLENLRSLCAKFKTKAHFARHLGKSPAHVGNWFLETSTTASIGHAAARQIEERMRLPKGWLDNDHTRLLTDDESLPLPSDEVELLHAYRHCTPEVQAAARTLLGSASTQPAHA